MALKIKNKNYTNPAVITAKKASAKLSAYMAARPADIEFVTFEEIRAVVDAANLPDVASTDLPDGMLMHIAQLAGLEVVEE